MKEKTIFHQFENVACQGGENKKGILPLLYTCRHSLCSDFFSQPQGLFLGQKQPLQGHIAEPDLTRKEPSPERQKIQD